MKYINEILTAVSVITLLGAVPCNKEKAVEGAGSAIRFGVSTVYENGPATKTEYSGKDQNNNDISSTSTAERIDWLSTDKIRILCNQATLVSGSDKYADYQIVLSDNGTGQTHSAGLSAIGNGLQWGEGSHNFFALYPSTKQNSAATISVDGDGARITGTVPAAQTATLSGHVFKPDMDNAYMYAVTPNVSSGSSVQLDFKPLVTTLEFTLLTKAGDAITSKLTSVQLSSTQSEAFLAGTFTASLTTDGLTDVAKANITNGSNVITIDLGTGVQLSTTEAYTVTFLTLPMAQTELTLTLNFDGGITRTLELKDDDSWITVPACKKTYIWKVDAPKRVNNYMGAGEYTVNSSNKKVYFATGNLYIYKWNNKTIYTFADTFQVPRGDPYYFNEYLYSWNQVSALNLTSPSNTVVIPSSGSGGTTGWYVLSKDEWEYLLESRQQDYRFAECQVTDNSGSDIDGLLLFPDDFSFPAGITAPATVNASAYFTQKKYTNAEWQKLNEAGCVFLSASGYYYTASSYSMGWSGQYWTGTQRREDTAWNLTFVPNNYRGLTSSYKDYYYSVRLVHD